MNLPRKSRQNKSAKKRILKNTIILSQWWVNGDKDLNIFNGIIKKMTKKKNFPEMGYAETIF